LSLEIFKAEHFQSLAEYEGKGPAFTIFHEGEIVASIGLYNLWNGVAEAWMMGTPLIYKHPLLFIREAKKIFKILVESGRYVRVQAAVRATDNRAIKFLKMFEFKVNGFMPKYGPDGSDHYLMGRVN
jgi:hypothetical protein